jgi:hypothetical protein
MHNKDPHKVILSLLVFTLASCQCSNKLVWHIQETFFILKLAKIIQNILTCVKTCSSSQPLLLSQVSVFELPDLSFSETSNGMPRIQFCKNFTAQAG